MIGADPMIYQYANTSGILQKTLVHSELPACVAWPTVQPAFQSCFYILRVPHFFCVFICMTNPIQFLLNKFNGLHYAQDYLCLAKDDLHHPLHVYLVEEGRAIKDITKQHSFVGYHPLVFAFTSSVLSPKPKIELAFTQNPITN